MCEMTSDEIARLKQQLEDTQQRLTLANQHIQTLYNQVQDLEVQFKTALEHKKHSARYNLRQKLSVVMGLKIVYLNYCAEKTQEVEKITQKLLALNADGNVETNNGEECETNGDNSC
ncbi:uncharacterized protein LOC143025755 [Oratosquilla oratoria]|uniref:uncharacterized protein LOC143025755 n=1 Tax=Oratosquilla oratoria TaxID=337810 RepID=UPI003F768ECD